MRVTVKQAVVTLRQMLFGLIAGIVSGVLFLGIGGRLAMRVLAVLAKKRLEFSVEGTMGILFISVVLGMIGGMLFSVLGRYLPGTKAANGGGFGLLVYIVLIPLMPVEIQREALALGDWLPFSIVIFGLLFLCFGMFLAILRSGLNRLSRIRLEKSIVQY
jgi:hypothetical protein